MASLSYATHERITNAVGSQLAGRAEPTRLSFELDNLGQHTTGARAQQALSARYRSSNPFYTNGRAAPLVSASVLGVTRDDRGYAASALAVSCWHARRHGQPLDVVAVRPAVETFFTVSHVRVVISFPNVFSISVMNTGPRGPGT